MSAFDDFMIQYQDADLVDINSVIFEAFSETKVNIESVLFILPLLFVRGYIVIPIKKEVVDDKTCMAQI